MNCLWVLPRYSVITRFGGFDVSAGKRDKHVILQSPSAVQADDGQMINTWAEFSRPWASIKHISGISAIKSGADTSIVKASIRILRRAGVNAGMRVVFGATVYEIESVIPDEKNIEIDLICKVVNATT